MREISEVWQVRFIKKVTESGEEMYEMKMYEMYEMPKSIPEDRRRHKMKFMNDGPL